MTFEERLLQPQYISQKQKVLAEIERVCLEHPTGIQRQAKLLEQLWLHKIAILTGRQRSSITRIINTVIESTLLNIHSNPPSRQLASRIINENRD